MEAMNNNAFESIISAEQSFTIQSERDGNLFSEHNKDAEFTDGENYIDVVFSITGKCEETGDGIVTPVETIENHSVYNLEVTAWEDAEEVSLTDEQYSRLERILNESITIEL